MVCVIYDTNRDVAHRDVDNRSECNSIKGCIVSNNGIGGIMKYLLLLVVMFFAACTVMGCSGKVIVKDCESIGGNVYQCYKI